MAQLNTAVEELNKDVTDWEEKCDEYGRHLDEATRKLAEATVAASPQWFVAHCEEERDECEEERACCEQERDDCEGALEIVQHHLAKSRARRDEGGARIQLAIKALVKHRRMKRESGDSHWTFPGPWSNAGERDPEILNRQRLFLG